MVEQGTFNPKVAGSIPSRPTIFARHCALRFAHWAVVQRQDSGFWYQLSRFESLRPSQMRSRHLRFPASYSRRCIDERFRSVGAREPASMLRIPSILATKPRSGTRSGGFAAFCLPSNFPTWGFVDRNTSCDTSKAGIRARTRFRGQKSRVFLHGRRAERARCGRAGADAEARVGAWDDVRKGRVRAANAARFLRMRFLPSASFGSFVSRKL